MLCAVTFAGTVALLLALHVVAVSAQCELGVRALRVGHWLHCPGSVFSYFPFRFLFLLLCSVWDIGWYARCCAAEASNMCVSTCDSGIGQCMLVDTSVQSGVRRALAVACKAPGSSHPLLLQSSGAVSVACWGPCVCYRHVRGLKQQQRRQWPLVTTVSSKESFVSGL